MSQEEEQHFRWHQCALCGKTFDSEDALHEHEKKCKSDYYAVTEFSR